MPELTNEFQIPDLGTNRVNTAFCKALDRATNPEQERFMFTLAHLSDPHLGDLTRPSARALLSKRTLGFLSWHLRRRKVHEGPVLPALVEDLRQTDPDHTAVTGDLVNISLPEEFQRAAVWLRTLGDPRDVSVIPGNHDAYVPIAWDRSLGLWAPYMAGEGADGREWPAKGSADFPYLRRRGPLAVIGVSTAAPMPPHSAAGRIGPDQLRRLKTLLQRTGDEGFCRVVLIHHPPMPLPATRHKQLLDNEALRALIAAEGAELLLHGHTHVTGLARLKTPKGEVPVVGVPSASARPGSRHPSRYHLYRIARDGSDWRIDVEVRGMLNGVGHFAAESGFSLTVPA
jgi:3',5'-cyclic AMP phosphodiesterase CpdA